MGYLKEFQTQIANRDLAKFIHIWDEYCTCDTADVEELISVLETVKSSDFAKSFGDHAEKILPLWSTIATDEEAYKVLRMLVDLQTTNSADLAELALQALSKRYSKEPLFQERLKLVGLRTKENFQSALSNFDLLAHIKKGNFVYHPGGWGAGEIMDHSMLREQLAVEFENVSGLKYINFANAFKTLVPLHSEHFLALRFADADKFEKEARENPLAVIKCLLRDLGPKTASEIKDELCELVIPEKDWQKWWQNVRAKIKKDTEIESPVGSKDPFRLRKEAISHETQFLELLQKKQKTDELLLICYNFVRDHSARVKQPEVKERMAECLQEVLKRADLRPAQALQACFCLDSIQEKKLDKEIAEIIKGADSLDHLLEEIEIIAYKKLALIAIKSYRADWPKAFLHLLHSTAQGLLRDYLFKELFHSEHKELLEKGLKDLLAHPWKDPEFFLWYFSKLMDEQDGEFPYHSKDGRNQFAEGFLILLHRIENSPEQKDNIKKMYLTLSNKRYALVRQIFDGSSLEFIKEYLLLASKCHTLSDHDLKIFRSLAEVVHPSLGGPEKAQKSSRIDPHTIWTTEEGYKKTQDRIKQIGTTEIIDNAREVETARAHGDLRENAEYKYAVEKRGRLQGELKSLSNELSRARIITPDDVSADEVGVGSIVDAIDENGGKHQLTILGPWEANPDENVLSFQSKVAQSMMGLKVKEKFKFKESEYSILSIGSIFGK